MVRSSSTSRSSGRRGPIRVDAVVPSALRSLGVASVRATKAVRAAWEAAADPSWRGVAEPEELVGGWLVIGVASAALREELAQFHRARLLDVLKTALPNVPIVGLRFVPSAGAKKPAEKKPSETPPGGEAR
jgi:hypothetical protein